MIIIGIVLSFIGLAYLCWLLFALAVYALPLSAGVTAGLAIYHSGSGPIGAIIVGLIASSVTLVVGQIAFMKLSSPLMRALIALLFAVPAAVAGYHAALGLSHIGIPAEGWRQAMAMAGAIVVAATACARMAFSALRPTPDKASPPV
jgi:succinate dehydrogenase/fumarate reductase cytochrome b subunit